MVSEHEARRAADGSRASLGAWFTPPDVVEGLLDLALDPLLDDRADDGVAALSAVRVLDPACGDGNFLVAAARRIAAALEACGCSPAEAAALAFGSCVEGTDIDPAATRACRAALRAAAAPAAALPTWDPRAFAGRVVTADALADGPGRPGKEGFDLVVGNPPFLGRLRRRTAPDRSQAASLRRRFGSAASGYTDPAALFLLLAAELARADGGRAALVLPVSVLAARDAAGVRDRVAELAELTDVWVAGEPVFDASVDVCALVLRRPSRSSAAPGGAVRLWTGRAFTSQGTTLPPAGSDTTWSGLLADAAGLPERELATSGTVVDVASATADFRDQYYGLAGAVFESESESESEGECECESDPRFVTVGLIDPAHLAWGERPTRFAKASWSRPRVRLADLDPALLAWARRRLVPKVLVATQTRVLEPVVDVSGDLLPGVPVLTVVPLELDGARWLWRLGALLASPPVTLVAARRHLGAGRNRDALRLRAADVLALPLPADRAAWDRAAASFEAASGAIGPGPRAEHLAGCAVSMLEAFGLGGDEDLMAWWWSRLPQEAAR